MRGSHVFWSLLDAGINGLVAIAAQLLIARLIGPEQLGVGVAATAVFQILLTGVTATFHDSIVQRPALSPKAITAASLLALLLGCLASGLMLLGGRLAAGAIEQGRVEQLALPLAVALPFLGFTAPALGLLTRRRAFRAIALRSLLAQSTGLALGVALAMQGHGALALVAHTLATTATVSVLTLLAVRDGFGRGLAFRELGPILRLGAANGGNALLFIARYRVFALLAGASGGAAFLGHLHMAFRLVDMLRDLATGALHRLLLTLYSPMQNDLPAMQAAYRKSTEMVSVIVVPCFLGLAVCLGPVVRLLLGEGWADAETPGVILAVFAAWSMVRYPSAAVKMAKGRSVLLLGNGVLLTVVTIGLVALVRPSDLALASLLWVGPALAMIPLTARQARQSLQFSFLEQLRPAWRGGLVAVLAAAASVQPLLWGIEPPSQLHALLTRFGVFSVVWLALAALLLRPMLLEMRRFVARG